MDEVEVVEEEIGEWEAKLENPDLTDEEIQEIEEKLEELQSDLEDAWYIKRHGIYAYNGVSPRDFM